MGSESPTATATVRFDKQPITSDQLVKLVWSVARGAAAELVIEYDDDGNIVNLGQTSMALEDHIRVSPPPGGPQYFSPNGRYSEVVVTSHTWESVVFATNCYQEDVDRTVSTFATALLNAYNAQCSK
ncbi:MAG: hypothetical protein PVI21_00360 [Candidatus Woesebacteria bacterium]|jgi:hypothetical protein